MRKFLVLVGILFVNLSFCLDSNAQQNSQCTIVTGDGDHQIFFTADAEVIRDGFIPTFEFTNLSFPGINSPTSHVTPTYFYVGLGGGDTIPIDDAGFDSLTDVFTMGGEYFSNTIPDIFDKPFGDPLCVLKDGNTTFSEIGAGYVLAAGLDLFRKTNKNRTSSRILVDSVTLDITDQPVSFDGSIDITFNHARTVSLIGSNLVSKKNLERQSKFNKLVPQAFNLGNFDSPRLNNKQIAELVKVSSDSSVRVLCKFVGTPITNVISE